MFIKQLTALCRVVYILFFLSLLNLIHTESVHAKQPEYFNPYTDKPFYLALGAGFGISNNPLITPGESKTPGGITLAGCLGFRFSNRFSLEFGPSVWIEGKDIFQSNVPAEERVSNKRTFATLTGIYLLNKHYPLSFKLGVGIGNMVYTTEKKTVAVDGLNLNETEYYNGAAITAGLVYQLKLSGKINIHPSINFYYCKLNAQKIEYSSSVNHNKSSLTTDIRIRFVINF